MKQYLKKTVQNIWHLFTTVNLTFLLTLNMFFIVALVASVAAGCAWIGIKLRWIPPLFWTDPSSWLIMTYTVCIVLAISIVVMIQYILLRPVRRMISAMKQLAAGDFSVRLHSKEAFEPRELREFSAAFNTAASELSGTELLRKDFIHNFSHEFKTPIVSMNGFANLLLEEDLPEEDRREYLTIIRDESKRLADLSTNILTFNKLESQSILTDMESYSLDEQLRQDILLSQQKYKSKALNYSIDLQECSYFGNRALLSEVWINLLDNAAKFSDAEGDISVTLRSEKSRHPHGTDQIIVSILDHGQGMDASVIPHIFDQFYQGDTSHTAEGNGLGLAMVQKILQLHHAEISVSSTPGHGSCFTVTLPLTDPGIAQ